MTTTGRASGPSERIREWKELPQEWSIARIYALDPEVKVRRRTELGWEAAYVWLPLFLSDVIRTETDASASLYFRGGSRVEVGNDTLVVIAEPLAELGKSARYVDRGIFRRGVGKAETHRELWLMTAAAVVRLRGERYPAVAKISVEEGRSVDITLSKGEGEVLVTQSPGSRTVTGRIELTMDKVVSVAAPVTLPSFGMDTDGLSWPDSSRQVASPSPDRELLVASPRNNSEVRGNFVEFRGKITGPGTKLSINGTEVGFARDLTFKHRVPLNLGANTVVVELIQPKGNATYRNWTIRRTE